MPPPPPSGAPPSPPTPAPERSSSTSSSIPSSASSRPTPPAYGRLLPVNGEQPGLPSTTASSITSIVGGNTDSLGSSPFRILEATASSSAHRSKQESFIPRSQSNPVLAELTSIPTHDLSERPDPTDSLSDTLDLTRFWAWVLCICVVAFDLELGQALEFVYPPVSLSQEEKKNISFSAFPDSNSSAHVGDSVFSFRMRSGASSQKLYQHNQAISLATDLPGKSGPLSFSFDEREWISSGGVDTDGHTYGYVFFRQQKDGELRRGFFQKSLVILSPHPWPRLFATMLQAIGPIVMDAFASDRNNNASPSTSLVPSSSENIVRSACMDICRWPPLPSSDPSRSNYQPAILLLEFLNNPFAFSIPPNSRYPQLHDTLLKSQSTDLVPYMKKAASPSRQFYNIVPGPTLACPGEFFDLFSQSLDLLWHCWELMMLGEPILVMGETAKGCSDVVWGLVELIKPVPFGGDFRPYMTIQDSDFKSLASRSKAPATALVLGATNSVLKKALEHWPHVLSVGRSAGPLGSQKQWMVGLDSPPRNSGEIVFSSGVQGLSSKHKPFFVKDKRLVKDVIEASLRGAPGTILDNMIRRHFVELTDRFVQPLNRHFEDLVVGSPVDMSLSGLRAVPEVKSFKQETFLKKVESSAPALPVQSRRSITEFYRLFLKSPNFGSWLQYQTATLHREWTQYYIRVLCESDVVQWAKMPGREEIETVDLLLRIREELVSKAWF
ncbi:hypothetical protein DFJ73DRAFT_632994 [Zopfochytrium polystomum]|nr:hypothetical protein DFJ73DRAFT_632994 [Zopfochytrium polystomum]